MQDGLFTSESVTEGHPDKLADQISDEILDAHLREDPHARVACETVLHAHGVLIAGEITSKANIDHEQVARSVLLRAGYNGQDGLYDGTHIPIQVDIVKQSQDIAAGVDHALEVRQDGYETKDLAESQGAGDQGMMFGYACKDTDELMPLPISLSHRLARKLAEVRKDGTLDYLLPDGKVQVTAAYKNNHPLHIETILISTQHKAQANGHLPKTLHDDLLMHVVRPVLGKLHHPSLKLLVNPAGPFVLGGPLADTGLTGRKIIVDSYGGMARHGGGAFSGKDPSKVDRSGAYAARYVAKNIIAAHLADRCEVQLAYAIGMAHPISVNLNTFGTHKVNLVTLQEAVLNAFDLRPGAIMQKIAPPRPIYAKVATYGHFGQEGLPWEETDLATHLYELCH